MSSETETRKGWTALVAPSLFLLGLAAAAIAATLFLTGVIGGDADPDDGAGVGPEMIPGRDASEWSVETETVRDPDGVSEPFQPTPSGPEGRDDDPFSID